MSPDLHRPTTPRMPETIVYRSPEPLRAAATDRPASSSGAARRLTPPESARRPTPPTPLRSSTPRKVSARVGKDVLAHTPTLAAAATACAASLSVGASRSPCARFLPSADASLDVRHRPADNDARRCVRVACRCGRTGVTLSHPEVTTPNGCCARALAGTTRRNLPSAFPQATPRFATLTDLLSHRCAPAPAQPAPTCFWREPVRPRVQLTVWPVWYAQESAKGAGPVV